MKITDYLKEKLYLILAALLVVSLTTLFLAVSKVTQDQIVFIDVMFLLFVMLILFVEYQRRHFFYRDLKETLDALDKKYLITEILEEPQFMDGRILYECLSEVDKSMTDEISVYRRAQQEYKEYVEMWVHEVKTPLASANLILDNHPSATSTPLKEELKKVERFVEQALFYAKSNTVEKDYIINKLTLSKPVHAVVKKHAASFIYRHITLTLDNLEQTVYADGKWLEFILDQIIVNALKYCDDHGTITISANKEEQQVCLRISDNGCGISAADLPSIFEKCFTGSNGRSHEKSTGIGLYLCAKLCAKMYLGIRAESTPQQGTTMIITFPLGSHYQF